MTKQEWLRLKPYWQLKKQEKSHQPILQGRSIEKGRGRGFGCVLKTSFVRSLSMETQHFQRNTF